MIPFFLVFFKKVDALLHHSFRKIGEIHLVLVENIVFEIHDFIFTLIFFRLFYFILFFIFGNDLIACTEIS